MANMRQGFQNVGLIDQLIESIKTHRFAMSRWDACICGHLARLKDEDIYSHDDPERWGGQVLYLNERQALELFCTHLDAEREDAIRVLEILRDEGVVDWERAIKEVERETREQRRREYDRMHTEAVIWEASHPSTLDRLHREFERLCSVF